LQTTSAHLETSLTNCIILTHTYIRKNESHKLEPLEYAVSHFRKNNPNDYIIVAGHGLRPKVDCDYFFWEDQINEKDLNVGHPRLCNIAFDHALEKGFTKAMKTRADSIHLIENVCEYSRNLLGDKKILVTQQTNIERQMIGDLYMFGELDFLKKCWNIDTWYPTRTGVTSLANNFFSLVSENDWRQACLNNLAFVDIYNLKWICLQKNWQEVEAHKKNVLDNDLPNWHNHLWGSKQKWHTWDTQGNFVFSKPKVGKITTEKDWK